MMTPGLEILTAKTWIFYDFVAVLDWILKIFRVTRWPNETKQKEFDLKDSQSLAADSQNFMPAPATLS